MKQILCFGDSNTWGYNRSDINRFPWEVRWPGRLQIRLGDSYRVIEEGLCSRTIAVEDNVQKFKSGLEYIEPCLMSHHPLDLIILMLGSNDTKCRYHLSPEEIGMEMEGFLRRICEILGWMESFDTKILVVSPPQIAPSMPADAEMDQTSIDKVKQLPAIFERLAKRFGMAYMDAGCFAGNYQEDGLHLSMEGHKQLAEAVLNKLQEIQIALSSSHFIEDVRAESSIKEQIGL